MKYSTHLFGLGRHSGIHLLAAFFFSVSASSGAAFKPIHAPNQTNVPNAYAANTGRVSSATAETVALLSSPQQLAPKGSQTYLGAITRGPLDRRALALCFTAHEYAEGAQVILDTLEKHDGRGSFFLTGDCLANTNFNGLIGRMIRNGHLVGPHSDKHLLYCSWEKSRQTLISREEFRTDLTRNIQKVHRHQQAAWTSGDPKSSPVSFFLPPFEHYNAEIAEWTAELRMTLVNYTPGTRSNADYTGEADKNFVSSDKIYQSILEQEARDPHGLNGFLLLLHLGSGPGRQDKFHTHIPRLLGYLSEKGYRFVTVEQLLAPGSGL